MKHPDSDTSTWPHIWLAKYAVLYGLVLAFLVMAFYEQDYWFLGLSAYLTGATAFFARRAANERIAWGWRTGLAAIILTCWAFATVIVFATPGDTKICYDRLSKPHIWAPTFNMGPDPLCDGIPLRDVKTGSQRAR